MLASVCFNAEVHRLIAIRCLKEALVINQPAAFGFRILVEMRCLSDRQFISGGRMVLRTLFGRIDYY
jgi:hypothetical protein